MLPINRHHWTNIRPTTRRLYSQTNEALEPSIKALPHLSPQNQQVVTCLIRQLAQTEGITVALTASPLTTPVEGISLWAADLLTRNYSPRTVETYRQTAKAYLAYDPTPSALSIRQSLAVRLGTVSPTRVNMERKALKSLFGYLVDAGLWDYDPTTKIKSIPIRRKEREVPGKGDIQKLLQTPLYRRTDNAKFKMIVVLLVDCGLRITEALSIEKANIDLDHLEIKVMGKGSKERVVPISPLTAELLKAYISQDGKSEWLFPGNTKLGYSEIQVFERSLQRHCHRLGIKPITPHQLRHAYATYSLRAGARLAIVSKLLGHSSIATTADIYTHWQRDDLREEHERYGLFKMLEEGNETA